jgi:hypothetical protein
MKQLDQVSVFLQSFIQLLVNLNYYSAIAGFQGSCTQTYFALGVDQVILENSNTKMRFSMNYVYNDGTTTYTSQWTRVKLNYLLVSDKFLSYSSAGVANYLWAGSV